MEHAPSDPDAPPTPPCAGGLLAGTLALMTCCVEPEPGTAPQRALLARKIVSNLDALREHPDLPRGMRLVIARLYARWSEMALRPAAGAAAASGEVRSAALH